MRHAMLEKIEIKSIAGAVLYTAEVDDSIPGGLRLRAALGKAACVGALGAKGPQCARGVSNCLLRTFSELRAQYTD